MAAGDRTNPSIKAVRRPELQVILHESGDYLLYTFQLLNLKNRSRAQEKWEGNGFVRSKIPMKYVLNRKFMVGLEN